MKKQKEYEDIIYDISYDLQKSSKETVIKILTAFFVIKPNSFKQIINDIKNKITGKYIITDAINIESPVEDTKKEIYSIIRNNIKRLKKLENI